MNCPKCDTELVKKFYKGMIEVDSCPHCRGMWLDSLELDRLEDIVFHDDVQKGSLIHFQSKTNFPCPHCGLKLEEFQYRLYDLKLEYCSVNDHGFWLDADEDERILTFMRQRAVQIGRKLDVESNWKKMLKDMHSFLRKK